MCIRDSNYRVVSSDPITGTEKNIGKLCVNICLNDIAAAGAEPVAIMVTCLIPPTAVSYTHLSSTFLFFAANAMEKGRLKRAANTLAGA